MISSAGVAQNSPPEDEKTLYELGVGEGQRLAEFGLTKQELEIVKRGITDGAMGAKLAYPGDPASFVSKISALATARRQQRIDHRIESGRLSAAKFAQKPGAMVLPSGVVYRSIKDGDGPSPQPADTITVTYRGTLVDGSVFADSTGHGTPPPRGKLDSFLPCWREPLVHMRVGGKAEFVCPPSKTMLNKSVAGTPPGSTLVFEVELMEVQPAAQDAGSKSLANPR